MSTMNTVVSAATKIAHKSAFILQKNSPAILLGVGLVGATVSTVLACKATLKLDQVIDNAQEKIGTVKSVAATADEKVYSKQDYQKDLAKVYLQSGVEFAKLYGPSVSLGLISYGCIIGGHTILNKRNVALLGAYKVVERAFSEYRARVREEHGDDADYLYYHGLRAEQVSVTEEVDGKKKKVKQTINVADPNSHSQYAKFFDESNPNWTKTPEYNLLFLKGVQNYMNDRLKSRGHLFLNEVYDAIGIERTQVGQFVGWVMGAGDDFVDFGLYDIESDSARLFVNGYERSILLDFNVDGVIWDLI